jgi:hypothetical protein
VIEISLPLREVSGLAQCSTAQGTQVFAVSDRGPHVATVQRIEGRWEVGKKRRVRGLPDETAGTQWEGVACDSRGRLVIVREQTAELLVVSPELVLERVVGLGLAPFARPNAGLESLLLLRDGHVLCARQRPVEFLEFAPPGEPARGAGPERWLAPDEEFDVPAALEPVRSWPLRRGGGVESVNDVAVLDSSVWVISSTSKCLARITALELDAATADVTSVLPVRHVLHGRDRKGEGLVLDPTLGTLIAIDTHADVANLFVEEGWLPD